MAKSAYPLKPTSVYIVSVVLSSHLISVVPVYTAVKFVKLTFCPKGDACWYKLFKNSLTEFHIQPDFSLTELNIAIMVIPFNTLFVAITTTPPQNTPLFANLCTALS